MNDDEIKAKAKADAEAEEKAKADADTSNNMKTIMDSLGSLVKRMDSLEEAGKPAKVAADKKADSEDEAEKKAKADADKEAEEKAAAKADSDFNARVDAAVAARLPREVSDTDRAAMADAQAKADSVAHAFGDSAPRPLNGETLLAYRKRLASKYKDHSPAWKDVDLTAIGDASVIGIAEKQIYADAQAAASSPTISAAEGMREIKSMSAAGHHVSTFVGNPGAWTSQFKLQSRRVTQIGKGT
jgi:hypothetical protein